MQQHELLDFLLDAFTELASMHAAAAAVAQRALSALERHAPVDPDTSRSSNQRQGSLHADQLVVNSTTFTVEWRHTHCDLGPTIPFKLMRRLARRPDRYIPYDILMEDVWGGRCSNATIRSAVKRLRRAMRDAGMPDLAVAIRGRGECYGLFLDAHAC